MLSYPDPPRTDPNSFIRFLHNLSSYDGDAMLAAVIALLLVILFVLLLHIYAKWFLAQARRRRQSSTASVARVLRPPSAAFHHLNPLPFRPVEVPSGLNSSTISLIPTFVYESNESDGNNQSSECVICLSRFEMGEIGRKLPKCGHVFHMECVDTWFRSHSSCPICRASVVVGGDSNDLAKENESPRIGDEVAERNSDVRVEVEMETEMVEREERVDLESIRVEGVNGEDVENGGASGNNSNLSRSSSSSSSSLDSLRRMLSRSRSERKVFPSTNANHSSPPSN